MTTILFSVWHRTHMNLPTNASDADSCCLSCAAFVQFQADIYSPVSLKLDLIFKFIFQDQMDIQM